LQHPVERQARRREVCQAAREEREVLARRLPSICDLARLNRRRAGRLALRDLQHEPPVGGKARDGGVAAVRFDGAGAPRARGVERRVRERLLRHRLE
jgi:hypothetical protein